MIVSFNKNLFDPRASMIVMGEISKPFRVGLYGHLPPTRET